MFKSTAPSSSDVSRIVLAAFKFSLLHLFHCFGNHRRFAIVHFTVSSGNFVSHINVSLGDDAVPRMSTHNGLAVS
jgi:hypothetical protein